MPTNDSVTTPTDDNETRTHGPSAANNSMGDGEHVAVSDVARAHRKLTRDNDNDNNVVVIILYSIQ